MKRNRTGRRFSVILIMILISIAWPWSINADPAFVAEAPGSEGDGFPSGSRMLPSFTNVSDTSGLSGKGGSFISWADFNDDGYVDFLVNGKNLYENGGPPGFMFTEVTNAKGLSAAGGKGVWGDYDNDGDLDLFVANWNDKLYQNQGPPNYDFVDVTVAAGDVRDTHPGTAASWGDMDNDGDLDLYIVNGEVWDTYTHYPDTLWENDGDGTFTNVTDSAGVNTSRRPYYGRGAIWADLDNDGWQDMYISNYRLQPNYLWYNNGNDTFTDVAKERDVAGVGRNQQGEPGGTMYGHTIGSSFADLNNDGLLDIFVSNLVHKDPDRGRYCDDSKIYINNGYPYWNFTDIRGTSGIPTKRVGGTTHGYYDDENWANAAIADIDNDGWPDVYIPQVYNFSWMYSYLYHNQGNLTWVNVSDQLGFENVVDTYAGAWADFDNDGDMDLMTAGRQNEPDEIEVLNPARLRLYRNDGNANDWLKVDLTGVESNRDGIGAKVTLTVGARKMMQQVESGMGSHGQQNDMRLNFGLGTAATVDSIEVRWPSGIVQILEDVAAGQQVNITEDVSGPRITSISATPALTTPDTEITVQGTTTGTVGTYSWDFEGDMAYDWSGSSNTAQAFIAYGTWEYHPTFKVMDPSGTLGFIMTTKVMVENTPPEAHIGAEIVAFEDDEVWFNASDSSDTLWDRANLTFRYLFGDGTNTSDIMERLVNHTYTEAGNYTVTLYVIDPFGETAVDTLNVDVRNVVPDVVIEVNGTVEEDSVLVFNATGNDTVSDIAAGLQYKWDFDDGEDTVWMDDPLNSHVYEMSGTYNATVSVRDDDGAISSSSKVITVYNIPPLVQVETKVHFIEEDGVVTLRGTASDTPSDEEEGLDYMWDLGDGNVTDWGTIMEVTHTYTQSGNYTALFIVRDNDNITVNDTAQVVVQNLAPMAQITEAPTDAIEDEEVSFQGLGIDTPTDLLSLQYKWEFGDGAETGWMTSADATHSYTTEGDFVVLFHVMDNDGDGAYVETTVTSVNPVPTIEVLSPERNTFDEDVKVLFKGNGSDNPSDMATLNFSWVIGGVTYPGKEVEVTFTKKGSFDAVLRAVDDEGGTAEETLSMKVNNVEPTVKIEVDRTTVFEGEALILKAVASDSPSDIGVLKYQWDLGGCEGGTGLQEANASCTFEKAGSYPIKVVVKDDEDGEDVATVQVTVMKRTTGGGEDDGIGGAMLYGGLAAIVIVVVVVLLLIMKDRVFGPKGTGGGRPDEEDGEGDDGKVPSDEADEEGKVEEE